MTARGVHFALTRAEEASLVAAAGHDLAVIGVLQEEIEEQWDLEWLCETDKAWDAIHRSLTDGTLGRSPTAPQHMLVLRGRQLHGGDEYIVSYLTAAEVDVVSKAVASVSPETFRAGYEKIDAGDYGVALSYDDAEYSWAYFDLLQRFFAKAASAGRAMVFSADQ